MEFNINNQRSMIGKTDEDLCFDTCNNRLLDIIPKEELKAVLSQDMCELDRTFLGFQNIYYPCSIIIPKDWIVIDFGCYLAAQAYFFKDHRLYIGVDVCELLRFKPEYNCIHYFCSIQSFIKNELPKILETEDINRIFAICSYVPDDEAKKMIREVFPNIFSYYPA